jgi:hypothetical protein
MSTKPEQKLEERINIMHTVNGVHVLGNRMRLFLVQKTKDKLVPEGVGVRYSLDKLRLLATAVRKARASEFSTEQTRAFLPPYGEELQERLNKAVRGFLQEKLG